MKRLLTVVSILFVAASVYAFPPTLEINGVTLQAETRAGNNGGNVVCYVSDPQQEPVAIEICFGDRTSNKSPQGQLNLYTNILEKSQREKYGSKMQIVFRPDVNMAYAALEEWKPERNLFLMSIAGRRFFNDAYLSFRISGPCEKDGACWFDAWMNSPHPSPLDKWLEKIERLDPKDFLN